MNKLIDYYSQNSISLHDIGSDTYAWRLEEIDAICAVAEENKLLILGGDILTFREEQLDFTYDSWHYDGDSIPESVEVMKIYISNYRANNGDSYLFSVILRD